MAFSIGLALAGSIGATTTGVIAGGVIGGVLNYGFDVATFGAHNVDGWQSFFRGATAGMAGATAGMGFFKGGWKGMVDAFFGEKNAYKKYTTESWVSKNLDNPLVNAVKDGILSIADARASGDYNPEKWVETMTMGFATSFMGNMYEESYGEDGMNKIVNGLVNPAQRLGLDYLSAYTAQIITTGDFNLLSPMQGTISSYFLSDGLFRYAGWSSYHSGFAHKQTSLLPRRK